MSEMQRTSVVVAAVVAALCWLQGSAAAPPPNDEIAGAEVIPPEDGGIFQLDMGEATASVDDPGCGTPVYQSLWLTYTSPVDQFVEFSLFETTGSSAVRPRLSVWKGAPGALAAADCHPDAHAAGLHAIAGTTYYLMVFSPLPGAGADILISVVPNAYVNSYEPVPPANDLFWYAEPITALPFAATPDVGAGRSDVSYDPPVCNNPVNGFVLGDTLWYRLEVETGQELDAVFVGNFDAPYVGVFSGDLDHLQLVACSYLGDSRRGGTRFTAVPGQTYHIEVASSYEHLSSLPADIAVRPSPPPLDGSVEVSPRVGTYVNWDWIDPIFVPNRHLVVDGFVFCDAAVPQAEVNVSVRQGLMQASGVTKADCSSLVGRFELDIRGVDINFHLGLATVTASARDFDTHFGTPEALSLAWIGRAAR